MVLSEPVLLLLQDPEQSPLLAAVLPPPGGWPGSRTGLTGLSSAEILPLASDPFWCRLRAALFGLFWVVMVALLASVVYIVVNDSQPCSARPQQQSPQQQQQQQQQQTLNVSLPVSALHALQAVALSRY